MRVLIVNFYSLIIVLFVLSVGCVPKKKDQNTRVVGHLVNDPGSLHPTNSNTYNALLISDLVHTYLLRTDIETLENTPVLLQEMPKRVDSVLYECTLRDGIFFDKNTPLTFNDILFSFKAVVCKLTNNTNLKSTYSNIDSLYTEPKNPLKFYIKFKNPTFFNLNNIATIPILQESFYDSNLVLRKYTINQLRVADSNAVDVYKWAMHFNSEKFSIEPSNIKGLGAYEIIEWIPNSSITLQKKDFYWADEIEHNQNFLYAYPNQIVYRVIKEQAAQRVAFENQQIDVSTFVSAENFDYLINKSDFLANFDTALREQFAFNFIALNTKPTESNRPPYFDKVEVRKAIAHSLPIDKMISTITLNTAIKQTTFISPASKKYYNDTLAFPNNDFELANNLLDKVNFIDANKDGIRDIIQNGKRINIEPELIYPASPDNDELVKYFVEGCKQAGISIKLKPLEFGAYTQNLLSHNYDMALMSLSTTAIPQDLSQILHTDNWKNNGLNFTGFGNSSTDSLLNKLNIAQTEKERIHLIKLLQWHFYKAQPYIFTYSPRRKFIVNKQFEHKGMFAERPGILINCLKAKN